MTEYVPMEIDLTDVVDPVLLTRPDNSRIKVITDVQTTEDMLLNSVSYMYAWEMWESYADALEGTIAIIRQRVEPEGESNM